MKTWRREWPAQSRTDDERAEAAASAAAVSCLCMCVCVCVPAVCVCMFVCWFVCLLVCLARPDQAMCAGQAQALAQVTGNWVSLWVPLLPLGP